MLTLFISSAATILVNHWYPCRRIPAFPSRWQLGFCGSLALLSISAAIVPSPSEMACQATPVVLVESGSAIVLQGFACVLFFCAGKILSGVSFHLLCKAGSPCLFIRGPPLGIAAHAGLPVLLGAGLAPRLAGNRRLAAVPALAEFPGSMQALLGIEPLVLHALRGLVSLPVVLPAGHLSFLFGGRYLLRRFAGSRFSQLLPGCGLDRSLFLVPVGLPAPGSLLVEVNGVLKNLSFYSVCARLCGANKPTKIREVSVAGRPPPGRG